MVKNQVFFIQDCWHLGFVKMNNTHFNVTRSASFLMNLYLYHCYREGKNIEKI